jgi:hypothetical protein
MERMLSEELSNDGVITVGGGREKNSNMIKGIVIGASVVAAGWLATCLYKKLKKRKPVETETEVKEELE